MKKLVLVVLVAMACMMLFADARDAGKITLAVSDVPVSKVLAQITEMSGVSFSVDSDILKSDALVTLEVKEATVDHVLGLISRSLDLAIVASGEKSFQVGAKMHCLDKKDCPNNKGKDKNKDDIKVKDKTKKK
jgi:hypothetical protein